MRQRYGPAPVWRASSNGRCCFDSRPEGGSHPRQFEVAAFCPVCLAKGRPGDYERKIGFDPLMLYAAVEYPCIAGGLGNKRESNAVSWVRSAISLDATKASTILISGSTRLDVCLLTFRFVI